MESDKISLNKGLLFCLLSILFLYLVGYQNFLADWWFEDDPGIFSYADNIIDPVSIFTSSEIIKGVGAGQAFIPMQLFSFWLDTAVSADISSQVWIAYLHQSIIYLLCIFLTYILTFRLCRSDGTALCVSLAWAFSPSTLSVLENLSARHYMEGFLFSLLALNLALQFRDSSRKNNKIFLFSALASCVFISMLFKEIYAGVLLTVLFLYALYYRQWPILVLTIVEAGVYFVYRFTMMGMDMTYTMRYLRFPEYLDFLTRLPTAFSANSLGYLFYLLLAFLLVFEVIRKRKLYLCCSILVVFTVCLLVIYPVSFALSSSYLHPGTWYRGFFLLNSCLIGSYLLLVLEKRTMRFLLLLFIILPVTFSGAVKTTVTWNKMKQHAFAEADHILSDNQQFLFGTQSASWYIPAVAAMYDKNLENYVHFKSGRTKILKQLEMKSNVCLYDKQKEELSCNNTNKYILLDSWNGDLKKALGADQYNSITFSRTQGNEYLGYFDKAVYQIYQDINNCTFQVSGWAAKKTGNSSNLLIIITNEQNVVLMATMNRHGRPDVGRVMNNPSYVLSGWTKTVSITSLVPIGSKLTAWVYDPNLKTAYFIDDILVPML